MRLKYLLAIGVVALFFVILLANAQESALDGSTSRVVVILIDNSNSTTGFDRLGAVNSYVDNQTSNTDVIWLVSENCSSSGTSPCAPKEIRKNLTNCIDYLNNSLDDMLVFPLKNTNFDKLFKKAFAVLNNIDNSLYYTKLIVFFSDGGPDSLTYTYPPDGTSIIVKANDAGIRIDTINLNDDPLGILRDMSELTGGNSYNYNNGNLEPTSLASIGDLVWKDLNGNGIQESGEHGVHDVTVYLYDSTGSSNKTNSTNDSGYYIFTGLVPGNYSVGFDLPTGCNFSPQNQGYDDGLDSDANSTGMTDPIIIGSGDRNMSIDCGIVPVPGSIGDLVWNDSNGNGILDLGESGVQNVNVTLFNSNYSLINETSTNDSGYYIFTGLVPGNYSVGFDLPTGCNFSPQNQGYDDGLDSDANSTGMTDLIIIGPGDRNWSVDCGIVPIPPGSIGDLVWNDLNGDGIQDSGEPGVYNITVRLYDSTGSLNNTTSTNETGNYSFTGLIPDNYSIGFDLPTSYSFSPQNQGYDDGLDSDANSTGMTDSIRLGPGHRNMSVDCGIYSLGSIGNFVWLDSNGNGIQDLGERGFQKVNVTLFNSTDSPTNATSTNETGNYSFTGLIPDNYSIGFDIPSGYSFSPQNQGSDEDNDSDANSAGMTDTVIIGPGDRNMSVDCGINFSSSNRTVVFAFDTSGSMKKYYRLAPNESAEIVSGWSTFGNASVLIVSWDHASELLFGPAPLMGNEDRLAEILNNLSEMCIETDLTFYDQGLNGSLAALRDPAALPSNSSKIIVFLTGYSEFDAGEKLDDYISEANRSGYRIFTIGIGINETFEASQNQHHNLTRISEGTGGNFSTVTAFSPGDLNKTMETISRELNLV